FRVPVILADVVAVLLGLSQAAFAGGKVTQSKERSPNNSETSNSTSQKSSKKRKSRRRVSPTFVVLGAYATPTVSESVSITSAAGTGSVPTTTAPAPTVTTRGTARMAKTVGVHVLPVEDPPVDVTATAGQLVISEFR